LKFWKKLKLGLGGFQSPEVSSPAPSPPKVNCQIHICDFQCLAKDIEGQFKICSLFMVYNHIWLNLHDHHFFDIFLLRISILATKKIPNKKNTGHKWHNRAKLTIVHIKYCSTFWKGLAVGCPIILFLFLKFTSAVFFIKNLSIFHNKYRQLLWQVF
jgi:hypothetical protein